MKFVVFITFSIIIILSNIRGFSAAHKTIVNFEPEFIASPANVTIPVGKEVVLSCTIRNVGEYKVVWLRSDTQTVLTLHNKVITHNTRIGLTREDDQNWNLHIRHVKKIDAGCYMCQINSNPMKSQLKCLDVHVAPDIITEKSSEDTVVNEGDDVMLTCHAEGHPKPQIVWRRKDGKFISAYSDGKQTKAETLHGEELLIKSINRFQMGTYLCVAYNDVPPAVSKKFDVRVMFPPLIQVSNQLIVAPRDTDVKLHSSIDAFPRTVAYWTKGDQILLESFKYHIEEYHEGFRMHLTLWIQRIQPEDSGEYKCVAENSLGRADITVRVYGSPLFHLPIDVNNENASSAYIYEKNNVKCLRTLSSCFNMTLITLFCLLSVWNNYSNRCIV